MIRIALLILLIFTLGASSSGNIQYSFEASDPIVAVELAKEFLKSQGFEEAGEVNGLKEFPNHQYSTFAYLGSQGRSVYLGFSELRGGCSSSKGVPRIDREFLKYQQLLVDNGVSITNLVASKSANNLINDRPSIWTAKNTASQ
ncbi:MAG: hypothetical protein OIF51_14130 [Cellvibrionaceae bacterium]|nr:hypothetical protein [Cellvibrionaceae bacterium]